MRRPERPDEATAPTPDERARMLAELRDLPTKPRHPFAVYLEVRGVSLTQATVYLGCSLRTLQSVVNQWHRPDDADAWASALGESVEELFPFSPEGGLVDARALARELGVSVQEISVRDRRGQPRELRGKRRLYRVAVARAWHEEWVADRKRERAEAERQRERQARG